MSNHGSKKPLNWRAPVFSENSLKKSETLAAKVDEHYRAGTPHTRAGTYNGHVPSLRPNLAVPELNPELTLKSTQEDPILKALGIPQVPRRQDQNQQMQMQQPGAAPGMMPNAVRPGMAPGMMPNMQQQQQPGQMHQQSSAPGLSNLNQAPTAGMDQPPVGQTQNGNQMFKDPFHPGHQQFNAQDHQEAAHVHEGEGDQQGAQAHREMANDSKSPMERAGDRFGPKPGMEERHDSQQPEGPGMAQMPGAAGQVPDQPMQEPQMGGQELGNDEISNFIEMLLQDGVASLDEVGAQQPSPGSSTNQEPAGAPEYSAPEKQTGPKAPPTHAGFQRTKPEI